ncbi:hypothetical protein GQ43DRAFT_473791 [Delitschia confertaspora ATCC 74209]|uniref:Uncharacterized protein n=1 Tax=Delitschia confertaspora ATCC 74209 TaxID=1513339 RepID=A0A9P4JJJ4_9PLEO|nr:hypothetical protein GQ43DRAFT_473791 [Delitschia confertaspora ATCC 74209]
MLISEPCKAYIYICEHYGKDLLAEFSPHWTLRAEHGPVIMFESQRNIKAEAFRVILVNGRTHLQFEEDVLLEKEVQSKEDIQLKKNVWLCEDVQPKENVQFDGHDNDAHKTNFSQKAEIGTIRENAMLDDDEREGELIDDANVDNTDDAARWDCAAFQGMLSQLM